MTALGTYLKQGLISRAVRAVSMDTIRRMATSKRVTEPFRYRGQDIPYLFHSYNNMGVTERSVEIPIVRYFLTLRSWRRLLEIGNVTNYYEDYFLGLFPNKTVVDKIEKNYNVITRDIAQFEDADGFDFIFSISTFEHMDADLGRNPDHVQGRARHATIAADNIIHCYEGLLRPGGLMVITAPLGYTPEWDDTFFGSTLDRYGFVKLRKGVVSRIDEQRWRERTEWRRSESYLYGSPYPFANHVSIIEIAKQP